MTREEAIKIVKEFVNGTCLHLVDQEALETLIPELAENDDERIRKQCIKLIREAYSTNYEAFECIDWLENQKQSFKQIHDSVIWDNGLRTGIELEKQKEQKTEEKPINWTELTWKDIVELEGIINNVHYEFRNGIGQESFGKEVLEKFREYKGDEYLDEKEQKPADLSEMMVHKEPYIAPVPTPMVADEQKPEWSEEDKAHRDFILESLEDQIRFCKKDAEGAHYAKQIRTAQNWLKALSLSLKKRNEDAAKLCSNEWSEEDETALGDLMWCIKQAAKSAKDENDMGNVWFAEHWVKNRLKSLRPQPKKELSIEKAIQWLDDTFYFLDNSSGRGRDCEITTHDFDSLEEMYDSFRKAVTVDSEPHWKPSEVQMNALAIVIDDYYHACTKGSDDKSKTLKTLFEQLKKL